MGFLTVGGVCVVLCAGNAGMLQLGDGNDFICGVAETYNGGGCLSWIVDSFKCRASGS